MDKMNGYINFSNRKWSVLPVIPAKQKDNNKIVGQALNLEQNDLPCTKEPSKRKFNVVI